MRSLSRVVGIALLCAFCYLLGLAFVAFMTDSVYVDLNLEGTTAWDECDDCGAFMSNEAGVWVLIVATVYTAACLVLGAYLISRRRRRDRATTLRTPADEASGVA